MPSRLLASRELSDVFKVMAHPDRIRLIEELKMHEQDVNTLAGVLNIPGPRVSQHLSLLKAHRFVDERREGRRHIYRLVEPEMANWVVAGLSFIEKRLDPDTQRKIANARSIWLEEKSQ